MVEVPAQRFKYGLAGIGGATRAGELVVITRYGKPRAVLLDLEPLCQLAERIQQGRRMKTTLTQALQVIGPLDGFDAQVLDRLKTTQQKEKQKEARRLKRAKCSHLPLA
jgi:antitoxin (DNA-binding transcriptional repressor) of toxin-antitoxin stability system